MINNPGPQGNSTDVSTLTGTTLSSTVTASSLTSFGNAPVFIGTITNDSASFGNVGEFVQTLVAVGAPVSLSNNTAANTSSINLSTGDWDVEGNVNLSAGSATITATSAGITTTSATIPVDGSEVYSGEIITTTTEIDSIVLPRKRISITSTPKTGVTAVAATDVITSTAHGYSNGQPVYFTSLTGGAGLVINTIYFVINTATDTFKLSATSGGAAIDITTTMTDGTVKAGSIVYLVSKCVFSAGPVVSFGQINARRVR